MTKEERREYYRLWYQTNGRNRRADYYSGIKRWVERHRLELNVAQRFYNYVSSGAIKRPSHCSICGNGGRINAHHLDYDKPFEVVWCCSSCHKRIHLGEDLDEQSYKACYIMERLGVRGRPTVFSIC